MGGGGGSSAAAARRAPSTAAAAAAARPARLRGMHRSVSGFNPYPWRACGAQPVGGPHQPPPSAPTTTHHSPGQGGGLLAAPPTARYGHNTLPPVPLQTRLQRDLAAVESVRLHGCCAIEPLRAA